MKKKSTLHVFLLPALLFSSVVNAQVLDDYRSNVAPQGQWTTIGSWERFDGSTWIPAAAAPTSTTANVITILTGDSITLTGPALSIDQVVIQPGAALTIFNASATTYTIDNATGDDIIVNGRLRIAAAGTTVAGTGNILIGATGFFVLDLSGKVSVPVTNNGVMDIDNTGIILNTTLTNNGLARLNSANLNLSTSDFVNNGTFSITSTGTSNVNNIAGICNFTNTATGILRRESSSGVSGIFATFSNAGIIAGIGNLTLTPVGTNTGSIRPGFSPGILTLNPVPITSKTPTIRIEILDGSGAGTGHDQLILTGATDLSGTNLIVEENTSSPLTTYTIMTTSAGNFTGNFASVTLPGNYTLNYTPPTNAITVTKTSITLPAIWGNFTALAKNGNQVKLDWTTLQEINTSHFVIEHSSDGTSFTPIATLGAAGNSSVKTSYSFTHTTPSLTRNNQYRILQVDIDNHKAYSAYRNVRFNEGKVVAVTAIPNPVQNILQVSVQVNDISIRFVDLSGRSIRTLQLQPGTHTVNTESFAKGIYQMVIYQNGVQIDAQRIIKL